MTTYTTEGNSNYSAQFIEVTQLIDLDGLDNLVGLPWGGFTALVPKTTQVGDLMVVFPAEAQLSEEFVRYNNLYSHAEDNDDTSVKGYMGKNRRVKAIKLRGHVSSALAMPVKSLYYLEPANLLDVQVGLTFDTVNGRNVSKKYVIRAERTPNNQAPKKRGVEVVFPLHYDTENYFRNSDKISPDDFVTATQKLHGTSVRFGRVPASRSLTWKDRLAKWFGASVSEEKYAWVVGSRKVTKTVDDQGNTQAGHFYDDGDIWSQAVDQYRDLVPNGVEIQKNYTYAAKPNTADLYVYRVTTVNPSGFQADLSWEGVKQFAFERGMMVVPELWSGRHEDFDPQVWLDTVYSKQYAQAVPLSHKGTVDEGVVVRAEGITPYALKAKSPVFLTHESKVLDEGKADLESEETI